jgi:hypothetical protein
MSFDSGDNDGVELAAAFQQRHLRSAIYEKHPFDLQRQQQRHDGNSDNSQRSDSAVFVCSSSVSSVVNTVDTMRICNSSISSLYVSSTRAVQLQHFSACSFTAAAASTSTFSLHICDGFSFSG